ncbi:MAR-binding filament-like protein 1 [Nicotiana tomentosiformis]|uniref:MAR-binding filament-like protein 1 n=1 Tax=Nicotiana tomentosiformis TaxID=4098 RepID=UPI00388CB707
MAEHSALWDVICDGPFVPMKTVDEGTTTVLKTRKEYNDADRKAIEKNFKAKKIFVCGIGPDEYNCISACQSAKEIWEAFQTAHEGTTQVKQSKIDMLTTEYELFRMKDDESIQDMHTRFTSIINELHSLGEIIPKNKLVRKILSVLPGSWESKVNAITEAKDVQKLTIDELIGNLKTYEMKKKNDNERRELKREKNLVLKTNKNDSSGEDADMAYLTKRFQKMVRRNGDKAVKRNQAPDKKFKRKDVADNIVKQALVAWGDSSSKSGDDDDQGDNSMMTVESEAAEYDSIFALMAKLDEDEEDNDEDEVNFLDVQRNLKSYSQKKLISLANILIDAYHSLINDKNALTMELGEIEHERDDLVMVAIDLRETTESLNREKDILTERSANIDHERDGLLVVVVDLKETIEELRRESKPMNTQKGKEVASEGHLRLENELKSVKSSLCAELEKNRQLQEDLGRVKSDLDKSLKWTWSLMQSLLCIRIVGGNKQGIRFQKEITPYNPHSKYVIVPDNWLCTHYGNTEHFKET